MRCDEIRELIEETNRDFPAQVREHLGACSECRSYARAWRLARGGLRLLAQQEVPQASPGFVARLLRRLQDAPYGAGFAAEFLELVGQRVVFVTLVLALAVTLVLALPLAGPLRGLGGVDITMAQAEMLSAEENDPGFAPGYPDTFDRPSAHIPAQREVRKK